MPVAESCYYCRRTRAVFGRRDADDSRSSMRLFNGGDP